MPKCPVCKTECGDAMICPECGFKELTPTFLNKEEGETWVENVVWPYRKEYWKTLHDFRIENDVLIKCNNTQKSFCVHIPYGVRRIKQFAFRDGYWPMKIELPKSIEYIDDGALFGPQLREIKLPAGLKEIGVWNFRYVQNIYIETDPCNRFTQVRNYLIEKETKRILSLCSPHYSKILRLPDFLRVDDFALHNTYFTEKIIIPDSVQQVGRSIIRDKPIEIFCEAQEKPREWDDDWLGVGAENKPIYWGGTWHYENGEPVPNK